MTNYSYDDLDDRYDDMLDEVYGVVNICGFEYSASTALIRVDPIAYRVGKSDWLDAELDETLWELPDGTYTDDETDLGDTECVECGERTNSDDAYKGMCPSCVHNARRSGWEG